MTILQAILLGIIQGITEFLPVSSSGHLELGQLLFGLEGLDRYIYFNLILHLGTLLAIGCVYRREILEIGRLRLAQIGIALLPLFPLLALMKPIKRLYDAPQYLGFFFLTTALLLYLGIRFGREKNAEKRVKARFYDPLLIGLFQALAILPGISRSGATISAARLAGWPAGEAVRFSFLLALPTIIGGSLIETLKHFTADATEAPGPGPLHYLLGFAFSFAVGYGALRLLIRMAAQRGLMPFVWYCLILGALTVWKFN